MKRDLYTFLKGLDNLEIKNLRDFENLNKKLKVFKTKISSKPENIENRLKIIMIDNILKANEQERIIFEVSDRKKK